MDNGRRIPDDAHSVATAVATALHRPLVVAWRARDSDEFDIVGPLIQPALLETVAASLRPEIEHFNGSSRQIWVGPQEWTAMAATGGDTTQHQVVVAVPDRVDDLTLEAIVESVGGALQAVLARLWWQTLTEAGPDVVVVLDAARLITHVSNSVRFVLGYRPSDLIGTDVTTLLNPDHVPALIANIDRRLGEPSAPLGRAESPLRAQVRHADGSWRWIETVSADRLDDPVIRGVILTCRDVTDLVEAHLALQVEQERMGFILDNSVDIIAMFRGDGTAEFVTPSVERVLGWPVEQFLGRTAFELIHPNDFQQVATSLGSTLQEPGERRAGRFRFLRHDGTWAWMEARAMIAPGRSDAAVVSARDVTQEMDALAQAEAEEARYQTLVEASPQAIVIHQAGHLVLANQAAAELLRAKHPRDL
ncbi:MAG: PAS domain S-box protein, partial [Acidimicrobiales bacterium]